MNGRDRVVSFLSRNAVALMTIPVMLYWSVDALLHSAGGAAGFVEHFFSSEPHHLVPRLIAAALILSLGFFLRAEYLRRRSVSALRERTGLAELGAAVGLILAEEPTLDGMLQRGAETIVAHLDAHFARVWLHDEHAQLLVLRASAGRYTHLDGPHARVPFGVRKIGVIASERRPHLTNRVADDPLFDDKQWVRQEGIVAFAGHPLVVADSLIGVMGLFSRRPLPPATTEWLAAVSRVMALGVSRHLSAEAVRRAGEEWSRTFDAMPDLVFTVDADSRVVRSNRALQERLGARPDEIAGRRCFELIHGTDAPPPSCPHVLAARDGKPHSVELFEPRLGGDVLLSVAPLAGSGGRPGGAVFVARDVSERKLLLQRLETAAYTDELTGLLNRRGFFVVAGQQVELSQRRGEAVGLLYVDIDLMKQINDEWGHQAGDLALQDTAGLLRRTFRKSDIIGRVGGDEFVVFLPEVADGGAQEAILASLQQALAKHNEGSDRPFVLELSGGIAVSAPGAPRSLEELLTQSDRKMYLEKDLSRARLRGTGRGVRRR